MRTIKLIFLTILLGVFSVNAQESTEENAQQSQEDLSKAAANPLADMMSLPFQNNLNMNYSPLKPWIEKTWRPGEVMLKK